MKVILLEDVKSVGKKDEIVEELINEAVEAAKKSKIAVVFANCLLITYTIQKSDFKSQMG